MDACTGLLRPDREFVDIQTRSRIPPKPYVRRLSKANKQRKRNRQIIAEYGKNRGIDRTCPDRATAVIGQVVVTGTSLVKASCSLHWLRLPI